MKKILKKNQIIIYIIALMLVTAGYLNFTTTTQNADIATSMQMESTDDMQLADIGDAQLVSSNDVVSESTEYENNTNNTNGVNTNTISDGNDQNIQTNIQTNSQTTNQINNQISSQITQTTDEQMGQEDQSNQAIQTSTNADNYFAKSKLERDTMYSQMLETYEKVLNSTNSLETQKQSATDEITKINQTKNSIMICENLITTKGFENNVIFVNGSSVSVIIGASELQQEEVAQIQNIISREMNVEIENIHIATKD